ncbi:mediator-associated protein 2 [Mercurialis annua]|uniref:mediator-associated protein 2 n=1 Tax=Mercurialis annua TaxID=3986 RepID=UPI00215EC914|nr:mediator-associated protein 2 [Mercurialis annua]
MEGVDDVAYWPTAEFEEDSREPLFDLSLTDSDSTEFWLIQWRHNELPDLHGKELSLNLHSDGCLASFEGSSGKVYDVVSCAAQDPDATVFLSSASETKFVGNISRRVSLAHFPDPKQLEKEAAEKKSKRLHGMSAGSSYYSATPTQTSKPGSSSRARTASTHSSRHKSSLSEFGEPTSAKRRQKHEHGASTDRSTLYSGRSPK